VHLREIPLESVLERLNCTRDPKDKHNWKTPAGRVTVTGAKFFAHDVAKGGGGAIDLVMLLEDVDYKSAVRLLAQDFGTGAVLSQAVATLKTQIEAVAAAPAPPYRAPEPTPENWPVVRRYLTETRKLSASTVDALHSIGKVYADKYKNAVFVLGKGAGVELRGTGEKPFHGVRGAKAPFILAARGAGSLKVAFVESAIDAMSLYDMGFDGKIVSLAGSSSAQARERAHAYRKQGLHVVAAFDNDAAGNAMAKQIEPCIRMRPNSKDWNDDLRARRATEPAAHHHDNDDDHHHLHRDSC